MQLVGAPPRRRRTESLAPLRFALILFVINLLAVPFARSTLARTPPSAAVFDTCMALGAAITAYTLLGRYLRHREPTALLIGAGYVFLAAFAMANMLTFPDLFVETTLFGATSQTSAWCFYAGLAAFGICAAWYAIATRFAPALVPPARARLWVWLTLAGALLITAGFVALTIVAQLPAIVDQDHYMAALTSGVAPATAFALAAALWLLWRGRRTEFTTWFTVAVVAALLEVVINQVGGARFTVGWFVSRVDGVVSALIVLLYFLGDINARLARSDAERSTQGDLLYAGLDVDTVMKRVTERILASTAAEGSLVGVIEGSNAIVRAAEGNLAPAVGQPIPLGTSLSGLAVKTNRPLVSDDTETDPRVNAEMTHRLGARSFMVAPIAIGADVIGVLIAGSSKARAFGHADLEVLATMADAVAAAMLNASQYGRARVEGRIDALTGLGNRRSFEERLDVEAAEYARTGQLLSLAVIDLNDFKAINDRYGHSAGDACLRAVADAMRTVVRGRDECFRIGGDEFGVIMPDTTATDATICMDRMARAIEQCASADGPMSASIGLAQADDGDPQALHDRADAAMYEAKRRAQGIPAR